MISFPNVGLRWITSALLLLGLIACSTIDDRPRTPRDYRAYGKAWAYTAVDRHTTRLSLMSPHGIGGEVQSDRHLLWLQAEDGKKFDAGRRVFALQSDGSYRKVECCDDNRLKAEIYNFDGKLILFFQGWLEEVTDCPVYPAGNPDYYKYKPSVPGSRPYVTFFGEYDLRDGVFRVNEFFPGDFTQDQWDEARGKKWSKARNSWVSTASDEEKNTYYYAARGPFPCRS